MRPQHDGEARKRAERTRAAPEPREMDVPRACECPVVEIDRVHTCHDYSRASVELGVVSARLARTLVPPRHALLLHLPAGLLEEVRDGRAEVRSLYPNPASADAQQAVMDALENRK